MIVPTSKKLNNKGATLIEMIVVVAIMAVMISGAIIAFTVLNSGNVKNASRTSKSLLEKTRTNTMSVVAEEWAFVIEKKEETHIAYVSKKVKDAEPTRLEETDIGFKVNDVLIMDGVETSIEEDDVLKIIFDKSTGSVSGVLINDKALDMPADNMLTLKFKSGQSDEELKLYFLTGKMEIE